MSDADSAPADPVQDWLERRHPRFIDASLTRIRRLLAALGHPERRLPPVVHVAGTNGKGSTLAFLRAFLEAAGRRVHAYTSPALLRQGEMIRVAGQLISDHALLALLAELESVNGGEPISHFELMTAAALLAFARTPADVVLLETGFGGRVDATNVVERPAATAITRLSLDHVDMFGPTLAEIAAEKAGILKPGVPLVLAPQPEPLATRIVAGQAAALGVPLVPWQVTPLAAGAFRFAGPRRTLELPAPALAGPHQLINAGVALAALEQLPGAPVAEAALRQGLTRVQWPGRLQRLSPGPWSAPLSPAWALWLDGGHNDSGGEALAAWAGERPEAARGGERPDQPLTLICGMLATKSATAFLGPLAPRVRQLIALTLPGDQPPGLPAEQIAAAARALGIAAVSTAPSLGAALALVEGPPGCLLLAGSLRLVGLVLRLAGTPA